MDTLSSSVSTIKIPSLHRKSHEFHHLNLYSSIAKPNGTSIVSSLRTTTHAKNSNVSSFLSSSQHASPRIQPVKAELTHKTAASGYAVALLDIARCNNVLEQVESDVKRLSKWLRNGQLRAIIGNPCVELNEKGAILKELVKQGMFHKYLVKLVNLLVDKAKFDVLSDVLMEFERIYDELSGVTTAQVVLVSSGVKLEKNQVLGIAKRVQKISGAIKVKVNQVVDKKLPSFAM